MRWRSRILLAASALLFWRASQAHARRLVSRTERLRQAWSRPAHRPRLAPAWTGTEEEPGTRGQKLSRAEAPESPRHTARTSRLPVRTYRSPMPDEAKCLAELEARGVPFRRAGPHFGIRLPIRLTGPIQGIEIRSKWRPAEQPLVDCLLALTLWRAAPVLRAHGVRRLLYTSTYRKGRRGDPRPSRHALGLAIDVRDVVYRDGQVLNVEKDWQKAYGAPGDCVGPVKSPAAVRLRRLVCDLERARIFRRILTPDSDPGHGDHFHMASAKPGEQWRRDRWAGRLLYQPLPGSRLFASWYRWYRCYKYLSWRRRKACYRRRRPRWVRSGSPYHFEAHRTPRYLARILRRMERLRRHRPARPAPPVLASPAEPESLPSSERGSGPRRREGPKPSRPGPKSDVRAVRR